MPVAERRICSRGKVALIHEEGQRLERRNFERLTATDISALELIVAANHIGLGLGEAGAVTLVGAARQLRALAANDPGDLVIASLSALGAGEVVRPLFRCFVKEFPLFHRWLARELLSRRRGRTVNVGPG